MQVLLVEDDVRLAAALTQILKQNKYHVDEVHDGESGFNYAKAGIYDVIILDVMLPKMNGLDVISELRRSGVSTPTMLLTARDSVSDKIRGLDAGADDYMVKPFSPSELMAHLRALTRRTGEVTFETIELGDLSLNLSSYELTCNGQTIRLSYKEFAILKLLMSNPGMVFSKDAIISKIWGADSFAEDNNVEAYISFLRKKLRYLDTSANIETIRKAGYRLNEA